MCVFVGLCVCVLSFFWPGLRALCATRWPCKWSEWATASQSGNFRNVLEALLLYSFSRPPKALSLSYPLTGVQLVFWLNVVLFSSPFLCELLALAFVYIGDLHVCCMPHTLYVSYGCVCACECVCVSLPQLRFKLHIKFMRVRLLCTCIYVLVSVFLVQSLLCC